MNGYVRNKAHLWTHAMKRSVRPGEKIPLSELYEQYGEKHGLEEGEEFVNWLRTVKLRNNEVWEVIFSESEADSVEEHKEEPKEEEKPKDVYEGIEVVAPIKDMTVSDVVQLSVRKGRDVLPRIMDLNLLKYSFQEANQLAGKDTICRMLRKRIQELEIAR